MTTVMVLHRAWYTSPYVFEALRRDLVVGGKCARPVGDEEVVRSLREIIEAAYVFHGVVVRRLVGEEGEEGDGDGNGNGEDGDEL